MKKFTCSHCGLKFDKWSDAYLLVHNCNGIFQICSEINKSGDEKIEELLKHLSKIFDTKTINFNEVKKLIKTAYDIGFEDGLYD